MWIWLRRAQRCREQIGETSRVLPSSFHPPLSPDCSPHSVGGSSPEFMRTFTKHGSWPPPATHCCRSCFQANFVLSSSVRLAGKAPISCLVELNMSATHSTTERTITEVTRRAIKDSLV